MIIFFVNKSSFIGFNILSMIFNSLFNKNRAISQVIKILIVGTKRFFIKSLSTFGNPEPAGANFIFNLQSYI